MIGFALCAWLVHNAALSQATPAESWLPLERTKHRKEQVTDIPGLQANLTSKHYAGRVCWLVTISQIMRKYLTCCRVHRCRQGSWQEALVLLCHQPAQPKE